LKAFRVIGEERHYNSPAHGGEEWVEVLFNCDDASPLQIRGNAHDNSAEQVKYNLLIDGSLISTEYNIAAKKATQEVIGLALFSSSSS
jgi:hypothetical protein